MRATAFHWLESISSVLEGARCEKACHKTTEPTLRVLREPSAWMCASVQNPTLLREHSSTQSNPTAPASMGLPSVQVCFCHCLLVILMLTEREHELNLFLASTEVPSLWSSLTATTRASLQCLRFIPFSTSCDTATQLHGFSLQPWSCISPSTRRSILREMLKGADTSRALFHLHTSPETI